MIFHVFLRLDFGIDFGSHFWWNMPPKWPPKSIPGTTFATKNAWKWYTPDWGKPSRSRPFSRHRFFNVFGSPYGTILGKVRPFWFHPGAPGNHFGAPGRHFVSPGIILEAIVHDFSCFLENRFRDRFLIALLSASTQITKNLVAKRKQKQTH